MGPEAITDQYSRFTISSILRLRIEDALQPLQANRRVSVAISSTRVLLPRGRKRSLVTSMRSRWPYNKRI